MPVKQIAWPSGAQVGLKISSTSGDLDLALLVAALRVEDGQRRPCRSSTVAIAMRSLSASHAPAE